MLSRPGGGGVKGLHALHALPALLACSSAPAAPQVAEQAVLPHQPTNPPNQPTHRCAQGNLAALYDTMPKAATLVEMRGDGEGPDLGSARRVLAADVAVGALMLVKPGQQVGGAGRRLRKA